MVALSAPLLSEEETTEMAVPAPGGARRLRDLSERGLRRLRSPDAAPPFQDGQPKPPWSRVESKSRVNLPQMPPLRGGICMGVDKRNHPFAPGSPPGR